MSWTALVPVKAPASRKMRLADKLAPVEREWLGAQMLTHVLAVLCDSNNVGDVIVLSPERPMAWAGPFRLDQGRGLNAELAAAARGPKTLIVHADLPLLGTADIAALTEGGGIAIAPDRHGTGTNALALAEPGGFGFAFGPDSFGRHCAVAGDRARVVNRPGLALDVDTPEDLAAALALGLRL
jgi:2-phospho-L-lactate guanylyltransferase